jgi:hypothetical protein
MIRRTAVWIFFAVLALAVAGPVAAQEKGKAGEKKEYKSKRGKYKDLAGNVLIEVIAQQGDDSQVLSIVVATGKFEAELRTDDGPQVNTLDLSGWISPREGKYLVGVQIARYVSYREAPAKARAHEQLKVKASALLANGEQVEVGTGPDTRYFLRVTELE